MNFPGKIMPFKLLFALSACFYSFAYGASFDCNKAGTAIEKSICDDKDLGRMDEVLAANYKRMMAADIGDGAKKDLKNTQRNWVQTRNKCTDYNCIARAYLTRIDEVCEYPVISGMHPECTSSDDVNKDVAAPKQSVPSKPAQAAQPQPKPQEAPAQTQNRTGGNQAVENAANKNAAKIAALGFSKTELQSMIYTKNDLVNPNKKFITMEGLLGLLFENQRISKVTTIESGKNKGFLLKVEGAPSAGFLFRFDGGDAFISHLVNGEEATRLKTNEEIYTASLALMQIAAAGLK